MTHDRIGPQLVDYLQNTLEGPARAEVEAHLEQCNDCREALATARELQGLQSLPDEALLGHVQAQHLAAFADGRLQEPVAGEVERHVARCAVCRDAVAVLRSEPGASGAGAGIDPADERPAGWWHFLRRTLLAPAPALAYLLLALVLVPLALRAPDSQIGPDPSIETLPPPVRLFADDRFRGPDAAEAGALEVELAPDAEALHLELVTDLTASEVESAMLELHADDGRILFRTPASSALDEAGLAQLIVPRSRLEAGRRYRVTVGEPSFAPLFESSFVARRP